MNVAIPISATLLSPFYYHGLYALDGSATHPGVITDTTLIFALQSALFNYSPKLRYQPDYKADIRNLPWRASLLIGGKDNDISREGGYQDKLQRCIASGNFKNTFFVHEVASGAYYQGLLYGPDPFTTYKQDSLIIRVGVGRLGLLELRKQKSIEKIYLNTKTASWFGRKLSEDHRILDTIRVSYPLSIKDAVNELKQWL